jgi:vacuolar-type H+-ATPase subunit I/STV1
MEDRVAALLEPTSSDEPAAESPAAEQDTEQEASPEPADDPLIEDAPPAPVEDFELTYNGEPLKVSKDEVKNLAQLGYHLQKAQERVTGELQAAQARAQQVAQLAESIEKQAPEVTSLQAQMQALQMLANAKGLNAAAIYQTSLSDPARAQEMQAEFNLLAERHQAAQQALNAAKERVMAERERLNAASLEAEQQLLSKILPQTKEPAKLEAMRAAIAKTMASLRPQTLQAANSNAEIFAAFAKAAEYDRLQASKRDNLARAAKAPVKPGTPNQMDPKTREQLEARKAWKRESDPIAKARAIERFLETKF